MLDPINYDLHEWITQGITLPEHYLASYAEFTHIYGP